MEATQLKAEGGAVQRVVVTGCLAQRYADDLAGTDWWQGLEARREAKVRLLLSQVACCQPATLGRTSP